MMQRFIYKLRENKWNMKIKDIDVLCELLKNGRISDRELARKLNISQSTVTRTRHRLEKKEIISYTALPNLPSLGINLLAISFGRLANPTAKAAKIYNLASRKNPQIVLIGKGEGMGKTGVGISLHRDFSDYTKYVRSGRDDSKGVVEGIETFFVPTTDFIKSFEIGRVVEHILKRKK